MTTIEIMGLVTAALVITAFQFRLLGLFRE